jgi:predicted PurR-regulated permease PerM
VAHYQYEGRKNLKVFIGVVIFFLIFLVLGWYAEVTIAQQAEELLSEIEKLATSVKNLDTAQISTQLEKINKSWIKSRKIWVLLIDHQDLDEFELYLARTKSFLANEADVLALSGIAEMKQTINRIPDQIRLTLENIF